MARVFSSICPESSNAIVFPIKFGKICNFFPIFQVEVQLDPIDRYQYFVSLGGNFSRDRFLVNKNPWDGVDIKLSLPIFTRCLPRVYISIIISSFLFPCCTNNSLCVIKFSNEKFTLDTYLHVQFPLPSLFARLSIPNFKWKIKMSLLHELTTCRLIRPTSVSQTAQPSSTQNLVELGAQ